jgi:hypothetical protein
MLKRRDQVSSSTKQMAKAVMKLVAKAKLNRICIQTNEVYRPIEWTITEVMLKHVSYFSEKIKLTKSWMQNQGKQ